MYSDNSILEQIEFRDEKKYVPDDKHDTCYITLSSAFAQKFLDPELQDEGVYEKENQALFKDHFKGLYFSVTPRNETGGGIIQVDHTASRMVMRTIEWVEKEDDEGLELDTLTNIFTLGNPESTIDTGGVHLSMYSAELSSQIENIFNDTVNLHDQVYLQSLVSPRIYVKIPELTQLRDALNNAVSVNKAQLILPVDEEIYFRDTALYRAPPRLGIHYAPSENPVLDDQISETILGGYIDTTNYEYILNIGNYVHEYLRNDESGLGTSFYLFAASTDPTTTARYLGYTPSRVVLNGTTSSIRKPYIKIIYSIIPN
jgi:hypothetical protein